MGRLGTTEDLAGPAVFMASDASKFMTGQELVKAIKTIATQLINRLLMEDTHYGS